MFKETENKRKRGRGWPIFYKKYKNHSLPNENENVDWVQIRQNKNSRPPFRLFQLLNRHRKQTISQFIFQLINLGFTTVMETAQWSLLIHKTEALTA